MEQLLTSNIIPSNHPISSLPKRYKMIYLRGLGEALSVIEPDSPMAHKAKVCFDILCKSLVGEVIQDVWEYSNNYKRVKSAQSIYRKNLKFFRMVNCFWWDVFRIAYQTGLPITSSIYINSLKKTTGFYTRKCFTVAFNHFYNNGIGIGLHPTLIKQSTFEREFHSKPLKRVLIVGTMSAGKSTLVNALVGKDVADVRTSVCTTRVSYIYNNPFLDVPICTDGVSISIKDESDHGYCPLPHKALRFQSPLAEQPVVIIDTPGVDYAYDESHQQITYEAINNEEYDVLLCVVNAPYYERNGEMELLEHIINLNDKKVLIIFNQLDRFKPKYDSIEESLKQFRALLKSKECNAHVIPLSAKTAYMLMQEQNNSLDEIDELELALLKKKFDTDFYDLGNYDTRVRSNDSDSLSRCGFTNLIMTILNQ